jgi:hypothetical protein
MTRNYWEVWNADMKICLAAFRYKDQAEWYLSILNKRNGGNTYNFEVRRG